MHDAPHARDAGAVEREPDLGLFVLAVGVETQAALAPANVRRSARGRDEMRRDFGERNGIVRTRVEVWLHDVPSKTRRSMSIGRAREPARAASAADREARRRAQSARNASASSSRAQRRGDVEVRRPVARRAAASDS